MKVRTKMVQDRSQKEYWRSLNPLSQIRRSEGSTFPLTEDTVDLEFDSTNSLMLLKFQLHTLTIRGEELTQILIPYSESVIELRHFLDLVSKNSNQLRDSMRNLSENQRVLPLSQSGLRQHVPGVNYSLDSGRNPNLRK